MTEPLAIHVLRLQDPRRSRLVVQRPEDGDKGEDGNQLEESPDSVSAERLGGISESTCRDVDELITSQPEDDRRQQHEHAWDAERDVRSDPLQMLERVRIGHLEHGDQSLWKLLEQPG